MRTITKEDLNKIIENHQHWINRDCEEWENMRANLCYANLSDANLCYVNLSEANLCHANFCGANLRGATLCNANLYSANLNGANLCNANLRDVNLCNANLHYANLCNANLCNANLYDANLCNANLHYANLCNANLHYANLRGVNLNNANLCDVENIPFVPMACPDEGSFTAWKKVNDSYLIKLEIPEDARRLSANGRKCRCDKAIVLEIRNMNTDSIIESVVNRAYVITIYRVGEMVYPDYFDENRWNECGHGIHFFINKQEAINY